MRLSQEQCQAIWEAAVDDHVVLDPQGKIIHHSHPGHAPDPDKVFGADWLSWVDPASRPAVIDALSVVRTTGKTVSVNLCAAGKNLAPRHLQVKFAPWPDTEAGHILLIIRDITEQKRAEQTLFQDRERLELALRCAGAGTWDWDMTTNQLKWSPELFRLFGLEPDPALATFETWSRVLHPEDLEMASTGIKHALDQARPLINDYRVILPDAQVRWIHALGDTRFDATGRPVRMIGICTDITELKRMEESLRKSEAVLRETQRVARIGSWQWDVVKDTVWWSDELYRLYAKPTGTGPFTFEEILQNYTPASAETLRAAVGRALEAGEPYAVDLERSCSEGETRWILARGEAVRGKDGKVVELRGTVQDITDRKLVEEALRASEDKQRKLLDTMFEGVALNEGIYDEHGDMVDYRIIEVNRAFYTVADFAPGTAVGEVATKLYGMGSDVITAFNRAHMHKTEPASAEFQSPRSKKWFSISTSPIKDGRFVTSFFDITTRKQTEEENRVLQDRLLRAEKMEALGTLAGGVAHDLNNVLGVVLGFSELLIDGTEPGSPIRQGLENVMKGAHRAAAIVDDLLALARRGVQRRDPVSLNTILAEFHASPEFTKLSERHPEVRFEIDLDRQLLNVSGSEIHLIKTLFNLISNACEAIRGPGTVSIRTTSQYLDSPLQGYDRIEEGDYAVLSVSDTGEGIPARDQKRIFEPFYTRKVMGRSGTGLGLAVVWGTVQDHKGYINVQSKEGQGSTFSLYFPVTREPLPKDEPTVHPSEYQGKGESILVVDDVPEQRSLAEAMLTSLNYTVRSVGSGEEAIEHLKKHEVDLVLLDMVMEPGMDGLDTFRGARAIRPKQKAILVSGFSESDRVKAARELGAGAYVRKPYIKEKLGLAVRMELDRPE